MNAATPIYKQIKDYLESLIDLNQHNQQYKLPSENQLALKFHSSRITVQRALNELEEDGRIYRLQGKGTFIAQQKSPSAFDNTDMICLLLPDIQNRYSREIINGAHDYLRGKELTLQITMTDNDPQVENTKLAALINQRYAGLLLFPVIHRTYHETLLKMALNQYPLVLIGHSLPGLDFSSVHCDYYQQLYTATSRLIGMGHQYIGFISEMRRYNSTFEERIKGYQDCMVSHYSLQDVACMEIDFYPESRQPSHAEIQQQVEQYFQSHPGVTALITTNMAVEHIFSYMDAHPEWKGLEITILDEPEYSGLLTNRKATVIHQMPYTIGRLAAEQLVRQIREEAVPREIIAKEEIVLYDGDISRPLR